MRINLVTTQPHAAASMFYAEAMKSISGLSLYDSNVSSYDVILVMTYDHELIPQIRAINSKAKIGMIDPRSYKVTNNAQLCDFLIVDSIEMEDYWSILRKPILRYSEYPNIPLIKKQHAVRDSVRIGYHGNLIHLDCMQESVTPAISSLAKLYNIELLVMTGGTPPSGSERWIPQGVTIKHVPWSMNNYLDYLSTCDIGIVPNNIIHSSDEKNSAALNRSYNYSLDDFSIRFKMPSNPGRFIIFGKLGIPVVADFYPSALQYLREDLSTGFVACNASGWEKCLEKLIVDVELRQRMGDGLQNLVETNFNFSLQNQKLLDFLQSL